MVFKETKAKPAVYLETSVIGYATSRPGRDLIVAAVHGVEYLLTWNCKHIANATMRPAIESVCREAGFEPPVICTPMELMDDPHDE